MESKPRILIIEDNPDLLRILGTLLSQDFEISTARRGEDGVLLAQTVRPDVIILDLMLPGMDGIEAGRWIKRDQPDVQILVLTAMSEQVDSEMILQSGCCDAYMSKPAPLHAIRSKVSELLRRAA